MPDVGNENYNKVRKPLRIGIVIKENETLNEQNRQMTGETSSFNLKNTLLPSQTSPGLH